MPAILTQLLSFFAIMSLGSLVQRYRTQALICAQGLLFGTLLTFISLGPIE